MYIKDGKEELMQEFSFNHLTDTDFEQFCYDLLAELKFINLNWRKGTGYAASPADHGRDIECKHTNEDIDGRMYLETWFVECTHYQQGVPPDKIQGALAWAAAERPDKLLIIASNFLSNPTKDYLESYIQNNRPSFRIKYWEKPDLERLSQDKPRLLKKYKLIEDTASVKEFVEVRFLQDFINFEINLRLVLLALRINIPRSYLASVATMWQLFRTVARDIETEYDAIVKEAIKVRNTYVHGLDTSYTAETFADLIDRLEGVSDFVRRYGIGHAAEYSSPLKTTINQVLIGDLVELKRNAGFVTEKLCGYGAIMPMEEDIFTRLTKINDMSGTLLEYSEVVQPIRDFASSGAWFLKRRKEQDFKRGEREELVEELTARHKALVDACNDLISRSV